MDVSSGVSDTPFRKRAEINGFQKELPGKPRQSVILGRNVENNIKKISGEGGKPLRKVVYLYGHVNTYTGCVYHK
jgi:hypothetical protein